MSIFLSLQISSKNQNCMSDTIRKYHLIMIVGFENKVGDTYRKLKLIHKITSHPWEAVHIYVHSHDCSLYQLHACM